jgi:hypothetical protein
MPKGVKRPAPTWGSPSIQTTETEKISISTLRPRLNRGHFLPTRKPTIGELMLSERPPRPKRKESPGVTTAGGASPVKIAQCERAPLRNQWLIAVVRSGLPLGRRFPTSHSQSRRGTEAPFLPQSQNKHARVSGDDVANVMIM